MKKIILAVTFYSLCMTGFAQTVYPLYKDSIPNSKPGPDEESSATDSNGVVRISKVSHPTITVYLPAPDKASGAAIIICPGGGYRILAASHEGSDVARKLADMGITAFVLKYRLPSDQTMLNKEIGPIQDAQQAINFVRSRAAEWNLNPQKIGIMGFSAGGHVASTAGTHFLQHYIDVPANTNLRPDLMILLYPVISFSDSLTHMGSRNSLLGERPDPEKKREYSNELQVSDNTPSTFIVHAKDDGGVKVQNSILFAEALRIHNVPVEMYLYEKGGHGFGMNNKTSDVKWMDLLQKWLEQKGWLKKHK
ncbi:MAG: alpha/beta hydrolase [Chitinophagaceae bacterium]